MKRILVTGFDPFGGETVNPAREAVMRLPDEVNGWVVTRLEIPTVFGLAAETVLGTAKNLCPDAIICVGQAGGRAAVTPEAVGINLRDASIPDNMGNRPMNTPVIPGAPAAYFATLPVRDMVEAVKARGIPVSFPTRQALSSATTCSIPSCTTIAMLIPRWASSIFPICRSRQRRECRPWNWIPWWRR